MKKKDNIIIFEGVDMVGKTFTLNSLAEKLKKKGLKVETFKFPNYDCIGYNENLPKFGQMLKKMLNRSNPLDWGYNTIKHKGQLDLLDKFATLDYLTNNAQNCDFFFIDRFLLSNFVYDEFLTEYFHKGDYDDNFYKEVVEKGIVEKFPNLGVLALIKLKEFMENTLTIYMPFSGNRCFVKDVYNKTESDNFDELVKYKRFVLDAYFNKAILENGLIDKTTPLHRDMFYIDVLKMQMNQDVLVRGDVKKIVEDKTNDYLLEFLQNLYI